MTALWSDAVASDISRRLFDLSSRIVALEKKIESRPTVLISRPAQPPPATDTFATTMMLQALLHNFTHTRFVRCPSDYYEWPLERRRAYLGAPSTAHLAKSIVLENTRHDSLASTCTPAQTNSASSAPHPTRSRYVCCVVPYAARIDVDSVRGSVRSLFPADEVPGLSRFNYRLAEDCVAITGYEPNAVTPLGLRTAMPVFLDAALAALQPAHFWLGGGEVSLKWHVRLDEFRAFCQPFEKKVASPN